MSLATLFGFWGTLIKFSESMILYGEKSFFTFFFISALSAVAQNSSYVAQKDTSINYTVIYQVLYNHDYSYGTVNPVKKVVTVRSHQNQSSGTLLMGHIGRVVNPSRTLAIGTMHVSRSDQDQ